MYYVYILFCSDRRLYIGFTTDVRKRLTAHKTGAVPSTKRRQPVKLVYFETYCNGQDAKAREVFLKSGAGHKQLKHQHKRMFEKLGYMK